MGAAQTGSWALVLTIAAAVAGCGAGQAPSVAPALSRTGARSEPVRVQSGAVTLDGQIDWPSGPLATRVPLVIIVHGSGRLDRDGNGPGSQCDTYKLFAQELAARGIATFRYDKRGVGKSDPEIGPDARTLPRLVDDVVAIVEATRRRPEVGRVTLLGHSEGSDVVFLATPRARPDAIISAGGSGRPLIEVLRTQLRSQVDGPTLAHFERLAVDLRAGAELRDIPADLEPLFRPRSAPWLRSSLDEDPAEAARHVKAPALVVRGANDFQVGAGDAARLAAAMPHARVVEIAQANHLFKKESSPALPQRSYEDPSVPLAEGVMSALVTGVARD